MKKILIVGGGVNQMPLILASKQEGYHVVVVDYAGEKCPAYAIADKLYDVSTQDEEGIFEVALKEEIDGIISNSEPSMLIVNSIAKKLGLNGNPIEGVKDLMSKNRFRELQRRTGVYTPSHFETTTAEEAVSVSERINFPIIIKPCESSASRGCKVIESFDSKDIEKAFFVCQQLTRDKKVVVEEYVEMPSQRTIEGDIFVMGDSVGVYELDASGNIVNSNVKFVYNAGLWHSDVVLNYQAGHRYFAYHPYRTNEQLTELGMTVDPTKIDYEGFFKTFADNWPVSDDQGTYEKYHACDLLAGEATWNAETATLGFPMHHLMGMLQLEFGIARIYLDWADEREDHYPYWWTDTVTSHLKEMILLPKFGGKYRRITRPGTELTVAAIDDAWTLHFEAASSISRGHYQHYDIGKTRSNNTEFYQMFYNQLGDILLQDGRLMHRHDWQRISGNNPVGIVVGTVYPAVDPFSETIVGPLETNADGTLYNCHSLEREYLYNMREVSRTGAEPDTVTVVMKPLFIRCLVMSLKDVSYANSGSDIYFAGSWGAAWSWNEALSHMPVTHCVGVAANNIWSSEELASRVNNSWYPNMSSSWNAVTACQNFNNGLDTHVYMGDGGIKQKTPNSGWFIGTCGQYQMAFCFGRERAFGDSWKKAHPREGHPEDLDNDG